MKIAQPLYQFNNERAILAVLGRKNYIFYFANQGLITKEEDFRFETESYSDKEGFFLKSGHGKYFGSGVPLKDLKEYQRSKFLKTFSDRLSNLVYKKRANFIYMFLPPGIVPSVMGSLDEKDTKIVKLIIPGNETKKHPLEIIRIIEAFINKRRVKKEIISVEAGKILSKSRKARKIIKGRG